MKIKRENIFDLMDEKFWHHIGDYLRYGIPAHDKKGHSSEVRFRVRPFQLDIIGNIAEQLPEGWYRNRTSFVKNLLATGCKVALEYFKRYGNKSNPGEVDKMDQLLKDMNRIAKYDQLDEFNKDILTLQQNILQGNQDNKAEIIQLLDKLKKEVIKEQGHV